LRHLLGNVAEWTASTPASYPGSSGRPSPAWAGGFHVVRGGSALDAPTEATVSHRAVLRDVPLPGEPDARRALVGVRCAADVD
jgi:formylglycine-generating enzyme required for sulfatase activity